MIPSAVRRVSRAWTVFSDLGPKAAFQRIIRRALPFSAENRAHAKWLREQNSSDAEFDAENSGLKTGGVIQIFDLTIVGENRHHGLLYAATRPDDFALALTSINIPFEEQFTFVDLGCGMGRTLAMASKFPFRRIIGVEFAVELAEIAQGNVRVLKENDPQLDIEVILGDAAEYSLPLDPLVVYMFNAFGSSIVRRVVSNAHTSWKQRPRPIIFVYMNPVHENEFDNAQWARLASPPGCVVLMPR